MLLKIKTVLDQMAMCPQQPYYEAFISPKYEPPSRHEFFMKIP